VSPAPRPADIVATVSSLCPHAALLCCLLAGCYAAPRLGESNTPLARVENTLARDLSTAGLLARFDNVTRHVAGLGSEFGRLQHIEPRATGLASASVAKFTAMPAKAASLGQSELGRWQREEIPASLTPDLDRWSRTLADRLANVPRFLGLDHLPMGEPNDLEHRTDPHDERPEATFWARVRRRLRL
jgi:hypothetical protein